MRSLLACLSMMLSCGSVLAVGTHTPARTSGLPLDPIQADTYAQQVNATITAIAEQYVRDVSPQDLVYAALASLYDAARMPIPKTLAQEAKGAATDQERRALLARVRQGLGQSEPLQGTNAVLVSLHGMLKILDPYCAVLTAEELNRGSAIPLADHGAGLELVDNLGSGPLLIKIVVPGGPAQRAGLLPGDQITHIDGQSIEGMTAGQIQLRFRAAPLEKDLITPGAEKSGRIQVTVRRAGRKQARKVTLDLLPYKAELVLGVSRQADNSWNYLIDRENKIAQVRLGPLNHSTADELRETLNRLKDEGMRGLILDLRWRPGGFLNESYLVAGMFLREGTIASIKYRNTRQNEEQTAKGDNSFADIPIVVLVNGETSGGAELIAAALQDNKRALVVGQRTLGKGSVQTMMALPIGNVGLKLTTGTFHRPNGKNLHRFPDSKLTDDWGVVPDAKDEVRVTAELSRQLQQWWLRETLRPGSSNEALPLDDPAADPQRQAAVRVLRTQVQMSHP